MIDKLSYQSMKHCALEKFNWDATVILLLGIVEQPTSCVAGSITYFQKGFGWKWDFEWIAACKVAVKSQQPGDL